MKKYPEIKPQYLKDEKNKVIGVYLDMNAFKSILEEISELSNTIKKEPKPKKTVTNSRNKTNKLN
jgi:hypothetical protein